MSVDDWVGVVDRAIQVVGEDHVALGSDFDGGPTLPRHMRDVRDLAMITDAMLRRGYSAGPHQEVPGWQPAARVPAGDEPSGIVTRRVQGPALLPVVHCRDIMTRKQTDMAAKASDSFPVNGVNEANPAFTRREMLGMTGMAGLAALTGIASDAVAQTAQKRPRIACLVSYWACATIACGLDRDQADGRLLVAGRPHAFAGGCRVRLHPSA